MPSKIARNTFFLTFASVGQKLFSFLYFTLIARQIGVEKIGLYVTALSFSSLFSVVADLGLTQVLIREGAKEEKKLDEYLGLTIAVKLILAAFGYGVLNLTVFLLGYREELKDLVWISGLLMILDSFTLSFYGALRSRQILFYEAIGVISGQILIIIFGVLALLTVPNPIFLLAALGGGSLFNAIFSFLMVKRQGIGVSFVFSKKLLKIFSLMAAPFALAGIFTKVYSYIDSVLLSYLVNTKEVGYYSIPNKVAFAFQFIPMAFAAALYPAMSRFYSQDKAALRRVFEKGLLYLAMLALPLSFGAAAVGKIFILGVYGAEYAPSILPFQILLASVIFAFLDFPIGALLNASNRQSAQTGAMGITMASNVIMNLFLIPRFGVVGAAISALASNIILFVIGFAWTPKIIPFPSINFWFKMLKIFICSALMGGLIMFLVWLMPAVDNFGFVKTFGFLVGLIITGGLFYIALLWITGVLRREEIGDFLTIFKRT